MIYRRPSDNIAALQKAAAKRRAKADRLAMAVLKGGFGHEAQVRAWQESDPENATPAQVARG